MSAQRTRLHAGTTPRYHVIRSAAGLNIDSVTAHSAAWDEDGEPLAPVARCVLGVRPDGERDASAHDEPDDDRRHVERRRPGGAGVVIDASWWRRQRAGILDDPRDVASGVDDQIAYAIARHPLGVRQIADGACR